MRILPLTMLMALMTIAPLSVARGADKAKPAAAASDQVQVQVEAAGGGATPKVKKSTTVPKVKKSTTVLRLGSLRVGPDGKVDLMDTLPPDVAKKVQEFIEKSVRDMPPEAADEPRVRTHSFDLGGSVTVIGPDGVAHTHKLGGLGGDDDDLRQILDKALKAAGVDLPDEVAAQLRQAFDQQGEGHTADDQDSMAAVVDRLDRINERLEKIERSLRRLKAGERPDDE